ncbi:MAG TPA: CAP domain-containing protein [Gallionella sp.]
MRSRLLPFIVAAILASQFAIAAGFDSDALVAAHNQWRAKVGVKEKLSYSPELAKSAQAWANTLMRTNRCQMKHSEPDGKYGENLYWGSAVQWSDGRRELQQVTPQQVVDSWGSEKADYDYASNSCKPGKMCGHYTQVVWRSTKTVGCAMAVCMDSQQQVWVCQYQPAGNWVGEKPY